MSIVATDPIPGHVHEAEGFSVPAGGWVSLPTFEVTSETSDANARAYYTFTNASGNFKLVKEENDTDGELMTGGANKQFYRAGIRPDSEGAFKWVYNPGASAITVDINLYREQ